jgi:hypothetical protein
VVDVLVCWDLWWRDAMSLHARWPAAIVLCVRNGSASLLAPVRYNTAMDAWRGEVDDKFPRMEQIVR